MPDAAGPASAGELAWRFAGSPSAITYHLQVLEAAGLVNGTRLAQWRPAVLVPDALVRASL